MSAEKLLRLKKILRGMRRVMVAYSGGVDSTFLLAAAVEAVGADNVAAVTAVSETYSAKELKQAAALGRRLGIKPVLLHTEELANPRFSRNAPDRCFHCKNELYGKLSKEAARRGMVLCDGTNWSDRADVRPGREAAKKWKVRSPLLEAKISKDEVRAFSRGMKLPTWNQPAQACLASRFPFGTPIDATVLRRIEKAEDALRRAGCSMVRVRHHGEIARIELGRPEEQPLLLGPARETLVKALKKLGWKYITLDLQGYRPAGSN